VVWTDFCPHDGSPRLEAAEAATLQLAEVARGTTKQVTIQKTAPSPARPAAVPPNPPHRRWPIVVVVVALVVIGAVVALLIIPSSNSNSAAPAVKTNPPLASDQGGAAHPGPGVTLGEFNQVTSGMSYAQVSQILRSPGSLASETAAFGVHDQTFIWNGATPGSNAIVGFQNGKVVTAVPVGLAE
jgi:hypothetical protein